ncbi:MAG: A1S_2505 family phage non-structural protein [Paludibacteraceae bacterium]
MNQNTKNRVASARITNLNENEVFVFGSNLSGQHGGGAARIAYEKFGAVWGQGAGLQGQSYGIPTMHGGVETIKSYVDDFILFAKTHPDLTFLVTRVGCGIAGFTDREMAPLFREAVEIENIFLPEDWWKVLSFADELM